MQNSHRDFKEKEEKRFMSKCPKPILIVEDDQDIRESIQEFLEMEGYEVQTAENGKVALQKLEEIQKPCLILLDLFMPVMSGSEFLENLKNSNSDYSKIPIIVVSAVPPQGELAVAVKSIATEFVKKPTELETIEALVQKYCQSSA